MNLEINHKNTEKYTKIWKQNNMLWKNEWVNIEIKEKIITYLETNENEDISIQNLWDTGKAIIRWKFVILRAYLKWQDKAQIYKLSSHWKELEKEQQTKSKVKEVEGRK